MKNGAIARDDEKKARTHRTAPSHPDLALRPASQNGHWVRIGLRCDECSKDFWRVVSGHLRCKCGQRCWIERWPDPKRGARFRYQQGKTVPVSYPGWMEVTK